MAGEVWVWAEVEEGGLAEVTKELLGEGRILAQGLGVRLGAALLGHYLNHLAQPLAHYGAEVVYLVDHPWLEFYATDTFTSVLASLIRQYAPAIFLCGDTPNGRPLAFRLAARLRASLVSSCIALGISGQGLLTGIRPLYGGKVYARVTCASTRPQMATFLPGVRGVDPSDETRVAEAIPWQPELCSEDMPTRHLGFISPDPKRVDLTEAGRIVSVGRGAGGIGGFRLLGELAELLEAALGGTRVAVDRGWLPQGRQIGASGKLVRPRLYLACGISGASQHVAGMKESEVIVAINTDRTAPILSIADLGVVGDLHEVVPLLISRLRSGKEGDSHEETI